ncbi:ribosome biogenesis protein ytm1 [Ophidiomyces ophidiicola]|uniref:ribosome biogenesis protein ytm1 n=1 Tax=Ophidiomyces ophidiicola TaxID=1387563 RepID=UPI0020C45BC6|nr:ribosome biogenesis protein ytm1 [Ophidiomyces ophidiicola]KAI1950886.1 ribosome biogenesis protein ytm1 [Ophidiomyces ophidiicola]KAI2047621.1 ribosome biogenesis protein ytm1 [Ophidiomyces ophidiicola]
MDDSAPVAAVPPSHTQVRLRFSSRDIDLALPESTGPILVPTGLRRYALSTLVNNLLATEKPVPLEFLINGTYLRTSIDEYLTANGISAETTLDVEYVRALIPPLHIASFLHDDWVSSVDVIGSEVPGQEHILSASYDGLLRVWNLSSEVINTSPLARDGGHQGAIKCARVLSPHHIVSSGMDRTVRLWKYPSEGKGLTPQTEYYGHKASVDSISVRGNRILSASADNAVGFWSTKKSESPAAPANLLPSSSARSSKRRKLSSSANISQRGPLAMLHAHTAPVSAAVFDAKDSTVGYSTSWDHSLRTWDLVTTALVDTRTTSHSLLCVEHLPDHTLLAAGSAARHVTLVDPRVSATTISAMTLRGHSNAVVCLSRDPNSTYGLISGSHDGTCRIWDIRSTKADTDGMVGESIYTISRNSAGEGKRVGGDGVKVFDVCWNKAIGILSVGEDKAIQINRGEGAVLAAA